MNRRHRAHLGIIAIAAFGLAACASQDQPPAPPGGSLTRYQCDDGRGFDATFYLGTDRADVVLDDGDRSTLRQVPSASGATYSDGRMELFTKGNTAFVEVDGIETHSNCFVAQ